MATISAKENYLRLSRGEIPEWVPGMMPYKDHGPSTMTAGPLTLWFGQSDLRPQWNQPRGPWKDLWGANFIIGPEDTGYAGIPDPNNPIVRDITKWRDIIKLPEEPNLDWEQISKTELENIDRSQVALSCSLGFQPFEQIIAFTGFNDGLCYLYEEPDEVKELLNFMCDWYVPIIEKLVNYYSPDVVALQDDTCAKYAPFFSVDMYREFMKPIYAKLSAPATSRGIPIDFHNCGKADVFVGDMLDFGVKYWNPAQPENDFNMLKEKYGNDIVICGGWGANLTEESTEEECREAVREHLDRLAKGGGYICWGGIMGINMMAPPSEGVMRVNNWISDEIYEYGSVFYNDPKNR
jgi:hypothetical protein